MPCRNPDIPDSYRDILLFHALAYAFPPFNPFPTKPSQEKADHAPISMHTLGPWNRLLFLLIGTSIPFVLWLSIRNFQLKSSMTVTFVFTTCQHSDTLLSISEKEVSFGLFLFSFVLFKAWTLPPYLWPFKIIFNWNACKHITNIYV